MMKMEESTMMMEITSRKKIMNMNMIDLCMCARGTSLTSCVCVKGCNRASRLSAGSHENDDGAYY